MLYSKITFDVFFECCLTILQIKEIIIKRFHVFHTFHIFASSLSKSTAVFECELKLNKTCHSLAVAAPVAKVMILIVFFQIKNGPIFEF